MGGDSFFFSSPPPSEDASLLGGDFPHESINSIVSSRDEEGLSRKLGSDSVIDRLKVINSGKFPDMDHSISSIDEAVGRQRSNVYSEVLRSYEELQSRIDSLEDAKFKIMSYAPGSWAGLAWMDLREYDVPKSTALLLIGPKGSGKSSLVNKISRALEYDIALSARAHVPYNCSAGDGTYFLNEYKFSKYSDSFCLYDTRSLSVDSSENMKMLNLWMKKGVRHGELIERKSDSTTLKAQLKCKARRRSSSRQFKSVDFVIFVVNGLSVIESMVSSDLSKKQYSQMIATNFNNPLLSFKDDKPVIVVTHGDLLPLSDRVRVRAYLGELLGIHPTKQIFDIPENNDSATTLAIFHMLAYSLERADRNLPTKVLFVDKVYAVGVFLFLIVMAMAIFFGFPCFNTRPPQATTTPIVVDWTKIRHLWLE